jgi:hypothetical protein
MTTVEDLTGPDEDVLSARHELASLEQQLLDHEIEKGRGSPYSLGKKAIFDRLRAAGHADAVNTIRDEMDEQDIKEWIAANRKTPFRRVDVEAVLGPAYRKATTSSQLATQATAVVPSRGPRVSVVPNQGFSEAGNRYNGCAPARVLRAIDSGSFLTPEMTAEVLKNGKLR